MTCPYEQVPALNTVVILLPGGPDFAEYDCGWAETGIAAKAAFTELAKHLVAATSVDDAFAGNLI